MKKQFLILTTAITTIVLISCGKENSDLAQTNAPEEVVASADKGTGSSFNAGRRLEFWFPFNGNVNDANGRPINAVISSGNGTFTTDRFGTANSAIKFDGSYQVTLTGMRVSTNMSVSAWVKYELPTLSKHIFYAPISLGQSNDKFSGTVSTPSTAGVVSNSVDAGWHHLVATYDGSYIKFYVDGNFMGENFNQGSFSGGASDYMFWISPGGWQGSLDELRFYTRTLSASDVQALYQL